MQSSFRYKRNCFSIKDDGNAAKFSTPCTENLCLSEKEIARILGPVELDSMETFGENYFCLNFSVFEYQLLVYTTQMNSAGRNQSIKIDDQKSNRSINTNRCMLVNWYRLVSANQ